MQKLSRCLGCTSGDMESKKGKGPRQAQIEEESAVDPEKEHARQEKNRRASKKEGRSRSKLLTVLRLN